MQIDIDKLTSLADSVASSYGLHVLDIKAGQQGKYRTLEVTIYRDGGRVSLSDCEQVSRTLEAKLDEESTPLMDSSFHLEVQSPGIDRKLSNEREYQIFSGQQVEVKTKQKVEGLGSAFIGKLVGLSNGCVVISHPKKVSSMEPLKRKSTKTGAKLNKDESIDSPAELQVEMTNIITVRLHPEMPGSLNTNESASEIEGSIEHSDGESQH